jgi:hypothetical protein
MPDDHPEDGPNSAAFQRAIAVSEDNLMKLHLQSVPGPAVLIAGKPFFSLIVFGGTEVLIVFIFSSATAQKTVYREVPSQMAAHLRMAAHCRLGR